MQNTRFYEGDFKIISELGQGNFGKVFKIQSSRNGRYYVLKTIDMSSLTPRQQKSTRAEVEILQQVNHPHIIQFYDSYIKDLKLHIIMEYAECGDLQKLINIQRERRQYLPEAQIWKWSYELGSAIAHLHSLNILHHDVKCMNVFLTKDRKIKLGDLGLSTTMQSENIHGNLIGTPLYISPEQIRKQPYGFKIDVWAYGCVLYNLACLFLPFNGNNLQVLYHNIVNENPKPLNPVFTPRLSRFILRLLEKNSSNRPSIFNALTNIPIPIKNEYRYRLSVDGSVPSNHSSLNNSIVAEYDEVNKSTMEEERPASSRVELANCVLYNREKLKSVKVTPDLRSVSGLRPSTGFIKNRPSLPFIKQDSISTARNPLIASLEFKRNQIPRPKKTTINDLAKIA